MIKRMGGAFVLAVCVAAVVPAWAARDGQLDPDFGTQGKAFVTFPGNLFLQPSGLVEIAPLPSGQMIVAGTVLNAAGDSDFAAIRLDADGSLDTSYGTSGGRRVGFDRAGSDLDDLAVDLLVQPDGKAVLVGVANGDPDSDDADMAVVRLTAAGALDSSFGTGGRVLVPFNLGTVGQRVDQGIRVALQSDGKLLVVGTVDDVNGASQIGLVRLTVNGQRDTGFAGDGRVVVDFGPDFDSSNGLQVRQLDDGKIVAVGAGFRTLPGDISSGDFVLAKFSTDGSPDASFGTAGQSRFDFAIGGNSRDYAYDFLELPDGRLLVCGLVEVNLPANTDMGCVRFLANGTPDPSFSVLVSFDRGGGFADLAVRMARDAQGRILLTGLVERAAGNNDFGIARLQPNGTLDPAFGTGGLVTYNSCGFVCFPADTNNLSSTLRLLPDGKIIVGGWAATSAGDYRFMMARLFGDVIFSAGFDP